MLKIFINPGHDMDLDPGACANNLREVDIALAIGEKVKRNNGSNRLSMSTIAIR